MAELEIKPTTTMRTRAFALVWLAIAITAFLMFKMLGGGGGLFARETILITYMPDTSGLVAGPDGSDVRLSGIPIGHVGRIQLSGLLDPQRAVRVDMQIETNFLKNIPSDSRTDINADTLIGNQFVDIAEGKSPIPIGEGGTLPSAPGKQATQQVNLIRSLQDDLNQVDQLLIQMTSPQTQLGQNIVGEALYDTALAHLDGFDQAVHRFLTPRSGLGQALYSPGLYNKLRSNVLKVDGLLANIQKGQGAAGRLFASDDQYNAAVRELRSLRESLADANAGKGRFAPLLHDDEDYRRIQHLLAATDAMLESLTAGDGTAARLLNNAQLYESLNGSLHKMEELLRDLREDPQKYLRVKLR